MTSLKGEETVWISQQKKMDYRKWHTFHKDLLNNQPQRKQTRCRRLNARIGTSRAKKGVGGGLGANRAVARTLSHPGLKPGAWRVAVEKDEREVRNCSAGK